ncbi:cupin domain-containing protein [Actinospica robiniae]|uniref:cupin domain-containing protein n=1 Tax=Actinospica robiniae TaxID=304901 RepID=UPI0003FB8EBD|nr:cupin domain-containing protein [Actinospica robiniae]
MPVIRSTEGTEHRMHGAVFTAYANSGTGSGELCAWSTRLPPGQSGAGHRISREEIFLVLEGNPRVSIDGQESTLAPGDVVVAPAHSVLRLDNLDAADALIWAATSMGLSAELTDGSKVSPPWAN